MDLGLRVIRCQKLSSSAIGIPKLIIPRFIHQRGSSEQEFCLINISETSPNSLFCWGCDSITEPWEAASLSRETSSKVTVNCIGLGHWGPNLVRSFTVNPEARVGSVCDLSRSRLDLVMRKIQILEKCSVDPIETIQDPAADAIVIATPVESHFELAKAALEAGKHVLVEKPICKSVPEARQLIELAKRQGKLLCVGHVFFFNSGVREVRNIIRSGELGRIRYIYSERTNLGPVRTDVNALWDLAAHDLSIITFWLGVYPINVTARGACYLNDRIEDVVVASFTYPDGVLACVHASWLNPRKVRMITVVGERKMLVWNDLDLNDPVRVYDKSVDVKGPEAYVDTFGTYRMQVRSGNVVIPHVAGPEPLTAECDSFIDCILGRSEPENDGQSGLAVVAALEAADRSLRKGSMIQPIEGLDE